MRQSETLAGSVDRTCQALPPCLTRVPQTRGITRVPQTQGIRLYRETPAGGVDLPGAASPADSLRPLVANATCELEALEEDGDALGWWWMTLERHRCSVGLARKRCDCGVIARRVMNTPTKLTLSIGCPHTSKLPLPPVPVLNLKRTHRSWEGKEGEGRQGGRTLRRILSLRCSKRTLLFCRFGRRLPLPPSLPPSLPAYPPLSLPCSLPFSLSPFLPPSLAHTGPLMTAHRGIESSAHVRACFMPFSNRRRK